jgi:fermentation-respiration switch protein FrsA (DUF1100 family)
LYHPTSDTYYDPKKLGLRPQEVWLRTEKDVQIFGWYFTATTKTPAKGVVVFFHGNAENLTSHYLNLVWLLPNGYDLFVFDYEGFGRSLGEATPETTVQDGLAALRYVHKRNPLLPLILVGQSLGGAVALETALESKDEIPLSLIVIDSSFVSYKQAARSILQKSWLTWILQPLTYVLLSDAKAPGSNISKLSPIPLVVIHGDADGTVDFALGQELFALAKEPKEFWVIPGGQHVDSFWRKTPNIREKLLGKLDRMFCFPPCIPEPLQPIPTLKSNTPSSDN